MRQPLRHRAFVSWCAAITSAAVVGLFGAPANASAADGVTLTVEAGVRGWYDAGEHVIVIATVESDKTIDGSIEVTLPFANTSIVRDIQVAGGTTKQTQLVIPTGFDQSDIEVNLNVDGETLQSKRLALTTSAAVEIVGILPALATRVGDVPDQVDMSNGLGRAQLEEIPDEYFTLGPTALDVYDTIIGVGGDLRTLDSAGLGNLLSWLNHGGRLLLDDSSGIDMLPAQWRPDVATYAWAGRGEIRIVNGLASSGKLADIIEPSSSSPTEQPGGFFGATDGGGSIQQDLAGRAGVRLPSLTPILIGMLIYIVIVGPVLYLALRMWRRLALGWVLIPAFAVVTSAVVAVVASDFRDSGRPAAAAFADGYPGGSEERLAVLTFTRSGGTSRVALPAGWQLSQSINGFSNFEVSHRFVASASGGLFQARLEPGQVTDADFVGLGADVGLRVESTSSGKTITGTVTNSTPGTLSDVAVFSAGDSQLIGVLAPGQSQTFELTGKPLPQSFGLAQNVWSQPSQGMGFGAASDKAEFAIWGLASERVALYPTGLVRAAGWTDDRPNPAEASTGVATRSVISVTAPVRQGEGPLTEAALRTVQVRSPFDQFGGGTGDSAMRYLLPPGLGHQQLLVTAASGMTTLEFWDGTRWIKVDVAKGVAMVPAQAVRDGVVLMQIKGDPNFAFDPSQVLFLRGATAKDIS